MWGFVLMDYCRDVACGILFLNEGGTPRPYGIVHFAL